MKKSHLWDERECTETPETRRYEQKPNSDREKVKEKLGSFLPTGYQFKKTDIIVNNISPANGAAGRVQLRIEENFDSIVEDGIYDRTSHLEKVLIRIRGTEEKGVRRKPNSRRERQIRKILEGPEASKSFKKYEGIEGTLEGIKALIELQEVENREKIVERFQDLAGVRNLEEAEKSYGNDKELFMTLKSMAGIEGVNGLSDILHPLEKNYDRLTREKTEMWSIYNPKGEKVGYIDRDRVVFSKDYLRKERVEEMEKTLGTKVDRLNM